MGSVCSHLKSESATFPQHLVGIASRFFMDLFGSRFFETGHHSIAQTSLEPVVLLTQPGVTGA